MRYVARVQLVRTNSLQSRIDCTDIFLDQIDVPPWIKRVEDIFDNPQFFIDGATAMDVHQGASGDCWFLASLMAVSAKKELIDKLCVARDEKVGVYGFVFYRDGELSSESDMSTVGIDKGLRQRRVDSRGD